MTTQQGDRHRLFCAADDAQREAWRNPNPETEAAAVATREEYVTFLAKQPSHGLIRSQSQKQRGRS